MSSRVAACRSALASTAVGLLLLTLPVTGAQDGKPVSWLDRPLTNWNTAGEAVPQAPANAESIEAVIARCRLTPMRTTPAERAIEAAGWIPYWNVDQQLIRDDVEIVGGMRSADGTCQAAAYNLFVFVGGRFAGVLSPAPMTSRLDSSSGVVRMPLPGLTAEFARYTSTDSACCPSSRVTVRYRIDRTAAGPIVAPVEVRPTRRQGLRVFRPAAAQPTSATEELHARSPRRLASRGNRNAIVDVRRVMRLMALLLATLACSDAAAQTVQPPAAPPPSAKPGAEADADSTLQFSLRKIREALERAPTPGSLTNQVEGTATFRIEITERRIEELLATLDFNSGPTPWGGLYAHEQQRIVFPSVDNPLAQPWASFNQRELLIIGAQSYFSPMLATLLAKGVTKAYRSLKAEAAHAEVARVIAEYCAGRDNGGAGIPICTPATAPDR